MKLNRLANGSSEGREVNQERLGSYRAAASLDAPIRGMQPVVALVI